MDVDCFATSFLFFASRALRALSGIVLVTLNISCLEVPQKRVVEISSTDSWFPGVQSVRNLGGASPAARVTWEAASRPIVGYRVYALEYDPVTGLNLWNMIAEPEPDVTAITHSGLITGKVYTYKVKAVLPDGKEDANQNQMSTVIFDGIAGVKITGRSTASVYLNSANGAFNEVRIYATPARGGARQLVGTARGDVQEVSITGLRSGTRYRFTANAYMAYLNAEDGNDSFVLGQTHSESFGSGVSGETGFAYKGVIAVQAFGLSPNAPVEPRTRIARITWLPFDGAGANTKYKLVRAADGNPIDTTVTAACTPGMQSSCMVCETTGASARTCTDNALPPPPRRFDYAIALIKHDPVTGEEWTEELPQTNEADFRISVHVPPDNMVLVQRDAANYEMCILMGSVSNPRRKQRCPYVGIGATPYNLGPNRDPVTFDPGFYDFGYNLFVDRFRLACNWTRTAGACSSANGCVSVLSLTSTSGNPDPAIGAVGNVLFGINTSYGQSCFVREAAGWTRVGALTNDDSIRAATTIDPGPSGAKHRPVLTGLSPAEAQRACGAQTTPYGAKRLMRRREHVVAAAFPTLPGEPDAMLEIGSENRLRRGLDGAQAPFNQCRSFNGRMPANPQSLTEWLATTNPRGTFFSTTGNRTQGNSDFFIGTTNTSNCVSRWGSQDPIAWDNVRGASWLADSFLRTNSDFPIQAVATVSDVDNGARDMGVFAFDGVIGPVANTTVSGWHTRELNSAWTDVRFYIFPLGLPLVSWTAGQQSTWNYSNILSGTALGGTTQGAGPNAFAMYVYETATRYVMREGLGHRFSFVLDRDITRAELGAWCAREAE